MNFSDPFGLCPWPPSSCFGRQGADLAASFTPGVSTGVDVATALTGTNPITGEAVGALGRGIAVVGATTPFAAGQVRAGFRSLRGFKPGQWLKHFMKHGDDVGAATSVEYLQAANGLLRGGRSVETFTRANGDRLFYRGSTNEFGVLSSEGTIRTYFKPDEGRAYWASQTEGN